MPPSQALSARWAAGPESDASVSVVPMAASEKMLATTAVAEFRGPERRTLCKRMVPMATAGCL